MGIQFHRNPLVVEQTNCLIKIVNIYIVCDLAAWPQNLSNNYKFKNSLFGATNIVKKMVIKKIMYIVDTE